MRYIIVCDACDAELRELGAVDYEPRFKPWSGQRRGGVRAPGPDMRVSTTPGPGSSV